MTKSQWKIEDLLIPDQHIPYNDKKYWKLIKKVARAIPALTGVQILGDFTDCYPVSRHRKDPARRKDLGYEIDATNDHLDDLETWRRWKRKKFFKGNHEERLKNFIADKCPELHGLVNLDDLFYLKERGWDVFDYKKGSRTGKAIGTHDLDFAGRTAVYRNLDAAQYSVYTGHTHRLGVIYEGSAFGKSHFSATLGHGIDLSTVDYKSRLKCNREWHQGFGILRVAHNGMTYIEVIPVVNYTCVVAGKLYSV